MRVDLKKTVIAGICALIFLSPIAGQSKDLVFPEVHGWEMGEVATYPTADLGYSVPYRSDAGGTVTFYVYDGGFKSIADGIDDKIVRDEIKKAESDIIAYGEAGYYQDVKLVKSDSVVLGGSSTRKVLYSLFSFTVRGTEVDSEIYLFGYKNKFIKIRATRAKGKDGADNAEVNNLFAEVGKIFK